METKLYAPKWNVSPLTVKTSSRPFSITNVAENLLRMELMQKALDEGRLMTAEQSFQALAKLPLEERKKKVAAYLSELQGNDEAMAQMYQTENLAELDGEEVIPAAEAYKELYEVKTIKEAKESLVEMLDENPLNHFLEESLPYESPYV